MTHAFMTVFITVLCCKITIYIIVVATIRTMIITKLGQLATVALKHDE